MHSVVPKADTVPEMNFDSSKWYRPDTVLDTQVYLTTVYFVDPSVICGSGRSQSEFDSEGTGNRLLFQNGPTSSDVMTAPLTVETADADVSPVFIHQILIRSQQVYF